MGNFTRLTRFARIALMLLLASVASVFLREVKDALLIQGAGAQIIPLAKMQTAYISVVTTFLFLVVAWRGALRQLVSAVAGLSTVATGVVSVLFGLDHELLRNQQVQLAIYNLCSVLLPILPILVWAWANQAYSFKQAALHYPLYGVITAAGLNLALVAVGSIMGREGASFSETCLILFSSASALCGALFLTTLGGELKEEDDEGALSLGYLSAFGLLTGLVAFAKSFPELLFKATIRTAFPMPEEFVAFMGDFSVKQGVLSLVLAALVVTASFVLYRRGRASWAKVIGLVLLVMVGSGYWVVYCSSFREHQSGIATCATAYALFSALALVLRGPIIELAYFGLCRKWRGRAKLIIDIGLLGLAKWGASIAAMALIFFKGSIESQISAFAGFFGLAMVTASFALFRMNQELVQQQLGRFDRQL